MTALHSEFATAEGTLKRLYRLVEDGNDEPDDLLRERLSALRAERDLAKAAFGRIRVGNPGSTEIAPELIERFGRVLPRT